MTVTCKQVARYLPNFADEKATLTQRLVSVHVKDCLFCQAQVVRYQKLRRSMQLLKHSSPEIRIGEMMATSVRLDFQNLTSANSDESSFLANHKIRLLFGSLSLLVTTTAVGAAILWAKKESSPRSGALSK